MQYYFHLGLQDTGESSLREIVEAQGFNIALLICIGYQYR